MRTPYVESEIPTLNCVTAHSVRVPSLETDSTAYMRESESVTGCAIWRQPACPELQLMKFKGVRTALTPPLDTGEGVAVAAPDGVEVAGVPRSNVWVIWSSDPSRRSFRNAFVTT
jgi:hypothetical protein